MMKKMSVPAVITILAAGTLVSCSDGSDTSSPAAPTSGVDMAETTTNAEGSEGIEPSTYQHYVALGDSFAAMGSRDADTTGPAECFRSADNYPAGVAEHERVEEFVDVSCASAVTGDIFQTRAGESESIAPQMESLTPETDLVTVSIGGNDIGFPGLAACFQEAMASGTESDCASQFDREENMQSLNELLFHVYQTISERSPKADVYVTGYLPLISAEGACEDAAFISDSDRGWAVGLTNELNGRIEGMSTEMGFTFVLPENASEHTVCAAPEERWTDLTGQETNAYPMHPTSLGQQAMADAIKAEL